MLFNLFQGPSKFNFPGRFGDVGKRTRRRTARPLTFEVLEDRRLLSATLLQDINPGLASSNPQEFTNVNGVIFFTANDGVHGRELWKTDGTPAGTAMVTDLNPAYTASDPHDLTNVNGTLFFAADDGINGTELWKSDGTAAGTVLVKDINPGPNPSGPEELTNVNGTLFFAADDGTNGKELWKSDGTAAGTVLVKDINPGSAGSYPQYFTKVRGTIFFRANDGVHGSELWKTDGTAAGTVLVKDIDPSSSLGTLYPNNLTSFHGALYFSANDGVHGIELWKSDGTASGTVLLKDINTSTYEYPGTSSYPRHLIVVGDQLLFQADDGSHATELWRSDGTTDGTTLVKVIKPAGLFSGFIGPITNVHGTAYFAAGDGVHGAELWQSDGTTAGTFLVADLFPGGHGSYPTSLVNVDGTLFFAASDRIHGDELFKLSSTSQDSEAASKGRTFHPSNVFRLGRGRTRDVGNEAFSLLLEDTPASRSHQPAVAELRREDVLVSRNSIADGLLGKQPLSAAELTLLHSARRGRQPDGPRGDWLNALAVDTLFRALSEV